MHNQHAARPDRSLHSLEEATNMLDRPEILVGDHVGVVAGM
jgi:hypothetical protein